MSTPGGQPSTSGGIAKQLKKKHFRVKHQKAKLFRASEPFLSVFMWGINHTINELMGVNIPVMLLQDDFRAYSKIKVDNHLYNKDSISSHFKVKEYCPLVFHNIRERFNVDDIDYKESLTRSEPLPYDASGKSGSKLYQSSDKLFIIKTLTSEQVELMHSFLKHYHPYIVERHGKTLLPQYLGMYRLTVDNVEHYIVAIRNVFSNHIRLHRKYDLKGSTVDREASEKEREKPLPTYKDNDFVNDQIKVYIGEERKQSLMDTLTADVEFLTKLNLMDYSLLLGIHVIGQDEIERQQAETTAIELAAAGGGGGEELDSGADDSGGSGSGGGGGGHVGGVYTTGASPPPLSPPLRHELSFQFGDEEIIPDVDIYAIPCSDEAPVKEIYFAAVIDVLTHYGVKKQAAKAAKTVKYGSNVDGISTCDPEQYARRFLDFVSKGLE